MISFLKNWISNPTVARFITAFIAVMIVVIIIRLIRRSTTRYIKDSDTRYRARKFITFIGYAIIIIVIAAIFSDKLGGLHVVLGVAGAGIAFSLQEVIVSVAGWFALTFTHFYKTGDRIQLGGIKGDVIDIGVLRTTLMEVGEWVRGDLYNGRVVRVANSFIFKEPLFNYSGEFPFLWDEIFIPIKYGSDFNLAKKIFQNIAIDLVGGYAQLVEKAWKDLVQKFLIEPEKVEPTVTMISNENWMEFTIRYVVDYKKRRSTKDRFFTRILEELEKTEGRVMISGATLSILETPVIDVRINDKTKAVNA